MGPAINEPFLGSLPVEAQEIALDERAALLSEIVKAALLRTVELAEAAQDEGIVLGGPTAFNEVLEENRKAYVDAMIDSAPGADTFKP